ncbi:hypothetical protein DH2020_039602 [Rehmannia glutinosa]|uniref:Aminotransferase-like plant mobile domain-containing protein n=1 Tax=Rehmannia glutinosa TaxID=99300 RepID=A0ABR0UX87_REHGL
MTKVNPSTKVTILAVFDPVVGRYATAWPRLTNPSYLEEWSKEIPSSKTSKMWTLLATHHQKSTELTPLPTLGRHIIEGQAKWGDDIKFAGEFHYIKGYWEWTEDVLSHCKNSLQKVKICEAWCPSTNTLLTSFGELSISLWDLHTLAGLPITGSLYDEVVPRAKELTGLDEAASRFLPRSCSYLLHAYHHLRKIVNGGQSSQVPISEWIRFWSKKLTKYNKPPPCTEKKRVARPKSTYNPLGNLDVHGEWRKISHTLTMGMQRNSSGTTSLQFVQTIFLCGKVDISSLNLIVLTDSVASLDFIKWCSECLSVRRASLDEGIHCWRLCTLSKTFSKACLPCMLPNAKKFSFEDYKTWWNKVHGCYFQENIASLINMEQSAELPRGTKPNNGGGLVDANSQASLHIAPLANECNAQANKRKSTSRPAEKSSSNADCWKRPKKDFGSLPSHDVDDVADHPLQMETFAKELEKDLVNIDDDESQGSQRSIVRLNELARNSTVDKTTQEETRNLAKATKTPQCAAFSVFEGGKFLYKHQKEFIQNIWSDLREKLASTSIDFISSIKEDVAAYDEARSISSEKGSKELLARQLSEAKDRLHDAKTKENKEFAQIMSTKNDLESIKKEIDCLQKWKKNLTASLKQQQELIQIAQAEVFDIEEEITAIESISPLSDEAVESLKVSALHLETAKEELKNLNPFA